ncbi:hypothetical protein GXN76_02210 [Kroppenstedtia pulmonis]|uniref:Uncharacterized protein n=1 Tax=Kroppenstedtia pulmonis TaxID=1380685 RepID=A0A7D3Y892_9BACL|nr:hypothetical protein [Kroppenstedtia pulmonis]QKG83401.1 hypothetical protein GXN76_02210 [Kroppenstedtia pulmonis]
MEDLLKEIRQAGQYVQTAQDLAGSERLEQARQKLLQVEDVIRQYRERGDLSLQEKEILEGAHQELEGYHKKMKQIEAMHNPVGFHQY